MSKTKYLIYIVQCADGTYYTGKTQNLEKRLLQHNGLLPKGAKYTRSRRPVVIKYSEKTGSNSIAIQREFALKKLTRKQKQALITKPFTT